MATSYLFDRPEGRLAYDVHGDTGAWVVCVPGMGELRQTYRHLTPRLVAAGHRVLTLDLRGHGGSDTTFTRYDDQALASDIAAVLRSLDGPATVVGSSMGAGAAVIAAAEGPERVAGLALLGPFVRDGAGRLAEVALRLLLIRPWGPAAWRSYYRRLYPGAAPEGHAEYLAEVRASLSAPDRWRAFQKTTRTTHAPAEVLLAQVQAPAVVVMGTDDPDWKDPAAEAAWVGDRLGAEVVLVEGVGHYPQAQAPEVTADAVIRVARARA